MESHTLDTQRKPRREADRGVPYLFRVLECDRPTVAPSRHSLIDTDEVRIGRGAEPATERLRAGDVRALEIRVPDPWMSKVHATLQRTSDHWILRDHGSTNGTLINGEPAPTWVLSDGDLIELGRTLFIFRDLLAVAPGAADVEAEVRGGMETGFFSLLPTLQASFRNLEQIAASSTSVIVYGETGTGKELVARARHALSRRRGRFVAMNCGAVPDTLIETELFGYRKGAFSGAAEDRPGIVRSAHQGTLFLDEIVEMPLPAQVALLRVLQEREVVPVGDTRPVPVDLRVVAASQSRLEALVESGRFRADFYSRIAGFSFSLPRLTDRREDIGVLLSLLLRRVANGRAAKVTFACEAARALFRHRWPLNVRELEKCLETALVLAGDGPVELAHLPEEVCDGTPRPGMMPGSSRTPAPESPPSLLGPEDAKRKEQVIALLREHSGNVTAVARAMGKARVQIQRWIKRYQLDSKTFRR